MKRLPRPTKNLEEEEGGPKSPFGSGGARLKQETNGPMVLLHPSSFRVPTGSVEKDPHRPAAGVGTDATSFTGLPWFQKGTP